MRSGLFYVYEHWRPDKDVCFYVGKGRRFRANTLRHGRNRYHMRIQDKLSRLGMCVEVRMVAEGLPEDAAFALEIERIAFWKANGVRLTNISTGGEGVSGIPMPEHQKKALIAWHTGRPLSEETKAKLSASLSKEKHPLWGKKHSPEAIEKQRIAARNRPRRPHTAETKEKMRISALARKDFKSHMELMWSRSRKHPEKV